VFNNLYDSIISIAAEEEKEKDGEKEERQGGGNEENKKGKDGEKKEKEKDEKKEEMTENKELQEPDSFDYAEVSQLMEKFEQGSLKHTEDQNQNKTQDDSIPDEELCRIVQQIEESVNKDKEKGAEKRKSPDVNTIERHVKNRKRDIKGTAKEDTFIYNTPDELKRKDKKKITKKDNQPHNLIIDDVDCTKETWKNLDTKTASKIKLFFDIVKDNV
jgi:hypothetical protein